MPANKNPCFISDSRTCQAANQKEIVFIIGSGSSEFKEDVEAITETLDGFGLEGYFALLSNQEKGLDAFCDKICSKIKESRFCVVMLNDPVFQIDNEKTGTKSDLIRVPSANVYFEFGIAVALEKPIIPIVRKGFQLPFDVQHLDAIIYDDELDLKKKLKPSILSTLTKKKKKFKALDSKIVDLIYGPLYNEISRFLSKKDRFTRFTSSIYQGIHSQYIYLLDKLEKDLRKEIELFYNELKEFDSLIRESERIIREIVAKQISDFLDIPRDRTLSIAVELETESGRGIVPTLDQILVRKTTPEQFLWIQGDLDSIRTIRYKVMKHGQKVKELDQKTFTDLFEKCKTKVENNQKIERIRELEADLRIRGKELKKKLFQLC